MTQALHSRLPWLQILATMLVVSCVPCANGTLCLRVLSVKWRGQPPCAHRNAAEGRRSHTRDGHSKLGTATVVMSPSRRCIWASPFLPSLWSIAFYLPHWSLGLVALGFKFLLLIIREDVAINMIHDSFSSLRHTRMTWLHTNFMEGCLIKPCFTRKKIVILSSKSK